MLLQRARSKAWLSYFSCVSTYSTLGTLGGIWASLRNGGDTGGGVREGGVASLVCGDTTRGVRDGGVTGWVLGGDR